MPEITWARAVDLKFIQLAEDTARSENVATLGVDERIWRHVNPRRRGLKECTGMIDPTLSAADKTCARLLDLLPGAFAKTHEDCPAERRPVSRDSAQTATLGPLVEYKAVIGKT